MKICIDPGHGGKDPGALGKRNTKEKDFVLDIAKKCAAYTIKLGHSAILTRDKDIFLELPERANIANKASVDVFISIHCNSADNSQANGIETYHYPNSFKGKEYATKVQNALIKGTNLSNRGVKEANFAVLRHTSMPGILIEVGFISNVQEEQLLMSQDFRDKVARAIAEGITGQVIKEETKPKYVVNYCLEFQKWYNKVTQTRAPLKEDGIYGGDTEEALEVIEGYIKQGKKYPYCKEFQSFYNYYTETKAPIRVNGEFTPETEKAFNIIKNIIREF